MAADLLEKADLLRVLGHPIRLAIALELASGPKCVTDIQQLVEVPQANVSQHLAALRHAHIVDFHEDGKLRCYYLARPNLIRVLLRFIQGEFPVVRASKESVRRAAGRRLRQAVCRTGDARSSRSRTVDEAS